MFVNSTRLQLHRSLMQPNIFRIAYAAVISTVPAYCYSTEAITPQGMCSPGILRLAISMAHYIRIRLLTKEYASNIITIIIVYWHIV